MYDKRIIDLLEILKEQGIPVKRKRRADGEFYIPTEWIDRIYAETSGLANFPFLYAGRRESGGDPAGDFKYLEEIFLRERSYIRKYYLNREFDDRSRSYYGKVRRFRKKLAKLAEITDKMTELLPGGCLDGEERALFSAFREYLGEMKVFYAGSIPSAEDLSEVYSVIYGYLEKICAVLSRIRGKLFGGAAPGGRDGADTGSLT